MNIKKVFKLLFCLLIIFLIYLLFFPRKSLDIKTIYDTKSQNENINFGNTITEYFYSEVNYINRLDIYIGESTNSFELSLFDEDNNLIHLEEFNNVNNVINVIFPVIDNSLNKKYKLLMTSKNDIVIDVKSNVNNNFITDHNDKSLIINTIGYKSNRSDLWYPLFALSVLITIYSLLEVKNEK